MIVVLRVRYLLVLWGVVFLFCCIFIIVSFNVQSIAIYFYFLKQQQQQYQIKKN